MLARTLCPTPMVWLLMLNFLVVSTSCRSVSTQKIGATATQDLDEWLPETLEFYHELVGSERGKALIRQGRTSELNAALLALVPDSQKTAVDYFVLANLFFRIDDDASIALMKRAESLLPDNSLIAFERGIHEHRQGNCVQALPYYERFLSSEDGSGNSIAHAYATHCYLRLGRGDDALLAWSGADFGGNHVGIEKGMYEIFGPVRPDVRREALLTRIRAGDHSLLGDLIALDSNYEVDWWNVRAQRNYLDYDYALAEALLEEGTDLALELALLRELPELPDEAFKSRLAALGLLGVPEPRVPNSGRIAYAVARKILRGGISTPDKLLEEWEAGLRVRSELGGDASKPFLEILAALYASTGNSDALAQVDELGWRKYRIENFAASYIVGHAPGGVEFSSLLERGLAEFPNNIVLAKLNLQAQGKGPNHASALDHYVAAEFANVRAHRIGSQLHDFMASYHYERTRSVPAQMAR